jgi:hypothetical protein
MRYDYDGYIWLYKPATTKIFFTCLRLTMCFVETRQTFLALGDGSKAMNYINSTLKNVDIMDTNCMYIYIFTVYIYMYVSMYVCTYRYWVNYTMFGEMKIQPYQLWGEQQVWHGCHGCLDKREPMRHFTSAAHPRRRNQPWDLHSVGTLWIPLVI